MSLHDFTVLGALLSTYSGSYYMVYSLHYNFARLIMLHTTRWINHILGTLDGPVR